MRKTSYLLLLLACAACADSAKDSNTSNGGLSGSPVTASESEDEGGGDADRAVSSGTGMVPGPALGSGTAAGAVGGGSAAPVVPGTSVAGGVAGGGTAIGGGASPGGAGGASFGAGVGTSGAAVAAAPTAPPVVTMPTFPTTSPEPQGGQLTAGAWDDNQNFARFKTFRNSVAQTHPSGIMPFTAADFDAAHDKFSQPRTAHQQLDVALVIDTTGSMGDEIAYLQREFTDLSTAIESAYPMAEQRWALVVYKDVADTYLTRQFDFRSDLNALRADLLAQSAGGGGDFPEAPEVAFEKLNQFQWRSGDGVAKLAFWVADAPHHDNKSQAMADALRAAQNQNIHIYPVASSGIDEFTELTMRSSAQLTGGRYLFLTNDSGIGGAHKEPSIPCYFVTRLDQAILRMVKIEMSGMYSEPAKEEIIRTGGNPTDGSCQLESGEIEVF
jgi:hypothetical protein